MDLSFNPAEDFVVFDGREGCVLKKSRPVPTNGERYAIDIENGIYDTGNSQMDGVIDLDDCLFRLIGHRNLSLVKQVFQRGVALAALDFSMADAILDVWKNDEHIELEDTIERIESGETFSVIAYDRSHLTSRLRIALRRNSL